MQQDTDQNTSTLYTTEYSPRHITMPVPSGTLINSDAVERDLPSLAGERAAEAASIGPEVQPGATAMMSDSQAQDEGSVSITGISNYSVDLTVSQSKSRARRR